MRLKVFREGKKSKTDKKKGKKRKKERKGPPWFLPFPSALVWPSPYYVLFTVFSSGMTKKAVKILAVQPETCSVPCYVVTIFTCIMIVTTFVVVAASIRDFHYFYNQLWKPVPYKDDPVRPAQS